MKNIFKAFAAVVLGAGLVSCSGFLDEKVTTTYGGDNMVSTKEALDAAALGCYQSIKDSYSNMNNWETFEPGSAVNHWGLANTTTLTNAEERWTCCLNFTRYSKHPQGYQSFTNLYKGIYRCNALIRALAGSPVEQAYKDNIKGDAYFARAWSYFFLVRQYADCSLITEAPLGVDQVYKPRENFWKVYIQIVKDLNEAEKLLPDFETMNARYGNSAGRVCNYAATASKALVYLTIGSLLAHPDDNFWVNRTPDFSEIGVSSAEDAFSEALRLAEDVMRYGPFKLAPSFQQLFRWSEPEDWQLKERIFVIPLTNESGNVNIATWTLPQYYNNKAKGNSGRLRPSRWFFQKWCETFGGDKGPKGKTNENIYVNCKDPRFNVTFIYDSYIGQNGATKRCYPYYSYVRSAGNNVSTAYPYCKKYYSPGWNATAGYADLYVLRYAEIYLIAAEAAANLSVSVLDDNWKNAVDYVNDIRKRARCSSTIDGSVEVDQPADMAADQCKTKDELITAIFWERCFEMNMEQHEWYDTHRMGAKWIVENICKPKNAFLELPEQCDLTFGAKGFRSYWYGANFLYSTDWQTVRKGLICAYPYNELIYNTELDQNKNDPNKGQNPVEVWWR